MAKDKLIFNRTTNYEELVKSMEEELPYISKYYFNKDAYDQAIASFHTLDEETRKKIVTFANHVDSKMNFPGQVHKNRYHKIPTILAGSIYLDLYPEKVEDLSLDELEILAKHSITLPLMFYKSSTMYYTKELLAAIYQIGPDFMYRSGYMFLTEKYFEQGKTPEEVTEYFLSTNTKDLLQESFDYERQIQLEYEEEVAKHESGRI